MKNVFAKNGQVFVRKNSYGTLFVGSFESSEKAPLCEGAGYVGMLNKNGLTISPTPLDSGLPDRLLGQGIKAALEASVWVKLTTPGSLMVRAFQSFEDSNWWTFYGVSDVGLDSSLFPLDTAGHGWFRLEERKVTPILAPLDAVGVTPAQVLDCPVWPGPGEHSYRLPQHPQKWCQKYHEINVVLGKAKGDAEVARFLLDGIKVSQELSHLSPLLSDSYDVNYLKYLFFLSQNNYLAPDKPLTAAQVELRTKKINAFFLESLEIDVSNKNKSRAPKIG